MVRNESFATNQNTARTLGSFSFSSEELECFAWVGERTIDLALAPRIHDDDDDDDAFQTWIGGNDVREQTIKFQYTFFSLEGKKRKILKNTFCCLVGDAWFLWVFLFWASGMALRNERILPIVLLL